MSVLKRYNLRTPALISLAVTLPACSWLGLTGEDGVFRDRKGDYLEARIAPPMEFPNDLDTITIDELYHIPDLLPGERALYITPPAPKPIDTRIREGVVVQRFGERAWIVIGATAAQVWPRLRDYWSAEGVTLEQENAVQGVMETVWLPQSDTDLRHKYRVWIEPGLHAGNTEIYVRHIDDNGTTMPGTVLQWPAESENLERESTILASISLYLADRTDIYRASSVSMLAGSIQVQGKASIIDTSPGNTELELRLDSERAWSQLTQAINNASIEVLETQADQHQVRVAFTGAEGAERPGFFRRLFTRDNNQGSIEFLVRMVDVNGAQRVRAEPVGSAPAPYEQDLLIRTINDNLI